MMLWRQRRQHNASSSSPDGVIQDPCCIECIIHRPIYTYDRGPVKNGWCEWHGLGPLTNRSESGPPHPGRPPTLHTYHHLAGPHLWISLFVIKTERNSNGNVYNKNVKTTQSHKMLRIRQQWKQETQTNKQTKTRKWKINCTSYAIGLQTITKVKA